jgi:Tfp pilus assembly protein PilW
MNTKYLQKQKLKPERSRGTTLIELIIYLAIASGLLVGVGAVTMSAIDSKVKANVIGDAYRAAANIDAAIRATVANSSAITVPAAHSTSSNLIVRTPGVSATPAEIRLATSSVVYQLGSNVPEAVTDSSVRVSVLTFEAISLLPSSTSTAAVRISYSISASSTGIWSAYNYSETFTTSASPDIYR